MPPLLRAALALLAALLPGPSLALSVEVAPIAFLGDAAPGLLGGVFGSSLSGKVNDAGQVAVSAGLVGGGLGVWTWAVASSGAPAPLLVPGPSPVGPLGAELSRAFAREITTSGRVGWEATLRTGPGGVMSSDNSLVGSFAASEGYTVVAREGDLAPGIPGFRLALGALVDAIPDWNDAGQVVQSIPAFSPPFSFSGALYRFEPAPGLAPIYVSGDPVPGDPTRFITGGVIHQINESGDVAFAGGTTKTPGVGPADATIFAPDGVGGFGEIARVGAQAPDTPVGTTFRFFPGGGFFSLNDVGQVAFAADLVVGLGGVTGADNSGVWVADGPTDITLRYREGDPIPGSPGLSFGALDGTPLLNDAGDLVLSASLALGGGVTTLDDKVLLVPDGAGDLMLLARENDANPILPGEVWGGFANVLSFSDTGALLLHAINGAGLSRFYYYDPSSGLALITGQGMSVDLGAGDVRTIDAFVDFDGSDDASRLLTTTRFTDGSTGLVLFSVPEPGTGLLTALGILILGGRSPRPKRLDARQSRSH